MSSLPKTDLRRARGDDTRGLILDAAREVLSEQGYTLASTRAIAERAGVRLSLVHYHFGGKQRLLAAVLDRENERLLDRQRALFGGPESLADKWLTACEYLREDLRSGYVRILWELWAVGLSDPDIAARWRVAMAGWRDLLTGVVEAWAEEKGVGLPISPRALATLVANAFLGAEAEMLAGVGETDAPHLEALESCSSLIMWAETRARDGSR
jgi:AcrR family transcriptional regulator